MATPSGTGDISEFEMEIVSYRQKEMEGHNGKFFSYYFSDSPEPELTEGMEAEEEELFKVVVKTEPIDWLDKPIDWGQFGIAEYVEMKNEEEVEKSVQNEWEDIENDRCVGVGIGKVEEDASDRGNVDNEKGEIGVQNEIEDVENDMSVGEGIDASDRDNISNEEEENGVQSESEDADNGRSAGEESTADHDSVDNNEGVEDEDAPPKIDLMVDPSELRNRKSNSDSPSSSWTILDPEAALRTLVVSSPKEKGAGETTDESQGISEVGPTTARKKARKGDPKPSKKTSSEKALWCKYCDKLFLHGFQVLKQHFKLEHPEVNTKHLNRWNIATFDLPISRTCTCCNNTDEKSAGGAD